jgi:hypothetical protein
MAEPNRDLIILGFRQSFYTRVTREPRSADGTPGKILKTEENVPDYWVKYVNRGMPQSAATEERLRHMDPANLVLPEGADGGSKQAFLEHRWAQIKPAFDAWLSGQQMPEYGIPLAAWPAMSPEQIKAFHSAGIRSIEDVRDMTEALITKVRLPNIRDLKKLAGLYIEGLGAAQTAEREAARDAEIAALREKLDAAMALLEQQAEQNAETEGGKRPAKAA